MMTEVTIPAATMLNLVSYLRFREAIPFGFTSGDDIRAHVNQMVEDALDHAGARTDNVAFDSARAGFDTVTKRQVILIDARDEDNMLTQIVYVKTREY